MNYGVQAVLADTEHDVRRMNTTYNADKHSVGSFPESDILLIPPILIIEAF